MHCFFAYNSNFPTIRETRHELISASLVSMIVILHTCVGVCGNVCVEGEREIEWAVVCRVSEGVVYQQRRHFEDLGRQTRPDSAGINEALQQHRALGGALQGGVGPCQ